MKIRNTGNVAGTINVTRSAPLKGAAKADDVAGPRHVSDTVAIMGIPPDELTPKVQQAIMALMAEVESLRQDLDSAHKRLNRMEQLVDLDPLVPVANRRAFVREISRLISFAERYGGTSSLIFIDVNNMKYINDKYGHAAGDKALIHIGNVLRTSVRETDVVGRLGGDEFGVLLAQSDAEQALPKAQSLIDKVEATPFEWEGEEHHVKLAFGLYMIVAGTDASDALAQADQSMYEHKRANKTEPTGPASNPAAESG